MIILSDMRELIMDKERKKSTPAGFEVRSKVPLDIQIDQCACNGNDSGVICPNIVRRKTRTARSALAHGCRGAIFGYDRRKSASIIYISFAIARISYLAALISPPSFYN